MGRSIVIAILFSACATAGTSGSDKQDAAVTPHEDAHFVTPDAPKNMPDAHLPDAFVPQDAPPDAFGVGDGGFCTDNNQCIVSGECCVTLGGPSGFCAPGTVFGGQCFPQ
jgi:hypothetical protein